MGEDACWSLELVETAGQVGRDGKRCLLELVDSWKGGKRWEKMPAGAGRQLEGRQEMGEDACWSW